MPSAIPGSACSGCRSGAGARSSQDCRGQRQTATTPALRLRLSLRKVRLRRPLRRLFATPYPGTSPAIRRSRSESRAGFCAMASRSARVWGGTPVWITARTCKPCALRTGKALTCTLSSIQGLLSISEHCHPPSGAQRTDYQTFSGPKLPFSSRTALFKPLGLVRANHLASP